MPEPDSTPSAQRTAWFTEARFGMFIHWGLYAIPARGEWVRHHERITDEAYQVYFEEFDPVRCDPRRWAALARRAGQKYAVMTAKHHDGFCLFDSQLTDYKATRTPAARDLIADYVAAFRAEGLRVGFYYSLLDWHHEHYPVDRIHPMRDDERLKAQPRDLSKYVDYLHGQVRELLTNYGRIDVLWLDFSYDQMSGETWRAGELVAMIRSLQPDILIDDRLTAGHQRFGQAGPAPIGNIAGRSGVVGVGKPSRNVTGSPGAAGTMGDFATPEQVIPPEGSLAAPGRPAAWEACVTINDHWGYARDDHNHKSPAQIVRMLVECVSKGGNLLLNVGPTALGEIDRPHVERLEAVGQWIEANGRSICGCGPADLPKPEWGRYTKGGGRLYAHILERPTGPIVLSALGGKVRRARLLADGSEVRVTASESDALLHLAGPGLPDPFDTVVALDLH